MAIINIERLEVGMRVADDVFSEYGSILLNAGERIDDKGLAKLELHNVKAVKIITHKKESTSVESKPTDTMSEDEKRKFDQFTKKYKKKTKKVKKVFDNIADSEATDKEFKKELTSVTNDIIKTVGNDSGIVKYIHKMKEKAPSIYTHSINVSILCNLFGTLLDYPEEKKDNLVLAGLLHDIGKAELGIELEYNTLNMESLDSKTMDFYKKHSTLGYRIVKERNLSQDVCIGILMHHESVRGNGFPTGAEWDQIHEFSKVIAIANFYDHITFSGETKEDINPFSVIKLLENIKYDKFDIQFMERFLKRLASYYQNELVELTSGETGEIVFINSNNVAQPIVKIGNAMVDLSREKDIEIVRVL